MDHRSHNVVLFVTSAFALFLLASETLYAQYPTRQVRIIVPTAPGGGNDLVARLFAQRFSERFGRPVIVENRTGAGTMIGNEVVAKSKPDGYTLLMAPAALAIIPALVKQVPYDTRRDFASIMHVASLPSLVTIHPSVPVRTVKEFMSFARTRPGQIFYGSAGHGTQPHLAVELFSTMAKIKLVHVAYKGTTPGLTDLVSGQIALMSGNMPQMLPMVRSGKVHALGVTTLSRSNAAPDIPAIAESGLPGYDAPQWYGFFAPAGTPREVIDRLNKEALSLLQEPEIRKRLAADGAEIVASTPEQFSAFYLAELDKWAKVARLAGIKVE